MPFLSSFAIRRYGICLPRYRTQKALRGAPDSFHSLRPAPKVRTPLELIRHMESVPGCARTFFVGGEYNQEPLPDFRAEVLRLHATVEDLSRHLEIGTPLTGVTPEQLLQGPPSDAMTHAGQLALPRRLAGVPVPPENFVYANVRPDNLGPDQPPPAGPGDKRGERPEGS